MPKAKHMMYTQQISSLPVKSVTALTDLIETVIEPTEYALITHDRDTDEQGNLTVPHVHLMLSFKNARSVNAISKLLKDRPQYLEVWSGDSNNGYAYLTHRTDKAKAKYQYPTSAVVANFDYEAKLSKAEKSIARAKSSLHIETLLNALYEGHLSQEEVETQLSGSQLGRLSSKIDRIMAKRLQRQAREWRKDMLKLGKQVETMWLYGKSGTGKTSLAKSLASKKDGDYFLSGSSRDAFQGYAGQHTLILDELRPGSIEYADLLKITDPFSIESETMAPARYTDKALACDLIIITSPYDPLSFHKEQFSTASNKRVDSFAQLLRRLTLVIEMRDTEMSAMKYYEALEVFIPIEGTYEKNLYSAASRPAPKVNTVEKYREMLGSIACNDKAGKQQ